MQSPDDLDQGVEMKSAEKELVEQRSPVPRVLSHQVRVNGLQVTAKTLEHYGRAAELHLTP